MKKLTLLALAGLALFAAVAAYATNEDTQTVTFEVQAINELTASGDPAALTVSTATAGSEPDDASNALTTYSITTNETGKKITGQIDEAMPANVTLTITLAAPTGGSSAGAINISDGTVKDLVTSIDPVAEGGKTITYGLSATVAAGVVASDTRTVTLTLTDEV